MEQQNKEYIKLRYVTAILYKLSSLMSAEHPHVPSPDCDCQGKHKPAPSTPVKLVKLPNNIRPNKPLSEPKHFHDNFLYNIFIDLN